MSIDLSSTYLHFRGETDVVEVPLTPDFWPSIGQRTELHGGRLLMRFHFDGDWPVWEIHPEGEEVVVMMEGAMTLLLELEEGVRRVPLRAGQTAVIPRGVWHSADVPEAASALFFTHGRGTESRPR